MSEYKNLKIYSYQHPGDSDKLKEEKNKRLNGYGTIKFPLVINPIDGRDGIRLPDRLVLFLVPISDYNSLLTTIRDNSSKIKSLIDKLPGIAGTQFFTEMLVNEIQGTNDIENVATTTKEINNAIENVDNNQKSVRLQSFAKMYLSIKKGKIKKIASLKDIRNLYDYLLKGEISNDKLPDGVLFRNGYVRVGTDTKTFHTPKTTENEINEQLENWIKFINNDSFDPILKACVAHYYFEYIHPFNDGNGRLGRYIFCSYIGKKIDPYTAISFSHQVNLKKTKYDDEFKEVENKKNYGEVTFFVIRLLKYLVSGQTDVLEKLKTSKKMLDYIGSKLDSWNIPKQESSSLFIYAQAFLFNDIDGSVEDRELYYFLNKELKISKKKLRI